MNDIQHEHIVVASYDSHAKAEAAIKALYDDGIDMKRLSIIAKDYMEEHAVGFYNLGDRVKFWGRHGALWGSLWGMLFGGAFLILPALGPVVVMGPLAAWVLGVLETAALGGAAGAIAGALASIGIPKDSIVKYEVELSRGNYLVLVNGTVEMAAHAHAVLAQSEPQHLAGHAPNVAPTSVAVK